MTEGREIQSYFKTCNPNSSYIFKWTIENYSKIKHGKELRSPQFRPYGDFHWYATFVKKIEGKEFKNYIVQLSFYSSSSEEVDVKIKVNIFDKNNDLVVKEPPVYSLVTKSATAKFEFYFQRTVSPGTGCSSYNAPYDLSEVVLLCEMNFSAYKIFTEGYNRVPHPSRTDRLNILSDALKKMYESSLGADITLKVQGCNIPSHKTILLARSDVLAKMFQSGMKESVTGVIEIDDIEPNVFKQFLEYLYTGVCPDTDFGTAQALYYAADKYCVSELKQDIVVSLLSGVTVENAVQLLSFANLHNEKDLQSGVIEFIKLHLQEIPILDAVQGGEMINNQQSIRDLVGVVKILFPSIMQEKK